MNYTKETVQEMFNGTGELYQHQKDIISCIKTFLKIKDSVSMDEIHQFMHDYLNRPETSRYNSFLTVLVNSNLLVKNEGRFYPTALMKCLI